jgi:tripartite-type tricarboxylate transporter receptor subunit TctC
MAKFCGALAGLCLLLLPTSIAAQEWPTRSVTMIVSGAAGSAPDVMARIIADRLSAIWGKAVVIDNKVGAAGIIGANAGANAVPDGYTLLFSQAAPLALTKFTHAQLPYNVERDFAPIINVGISPMIIAAAPQLGVSSLADLIKLAKAQPGKLSYTTSSARNVPHLTGELLKSLAGIDMVHVPSRTAQTGIADLMTGRVAMMVDGIPVIAPLMTDGRVKALVITSAKRMPGYEDLPALSETFPGAEVNGWFAIVAPTGTPPHVVARANRDLQAILKEPEFASRAEKLGVYPVGGTPEMLTEFIREDLKRWERAVTAAGLTKE